MDYRERKYYLVLAPYNYVDDIIYYVKHTFISSKVHVMKKENIPEWSTKIMVSCNYIENKRLRQLLVAIAELIFLRNEWDYKYTSNFYCYHKERKYMQVKELNKDNLGQ